MILLTQARQQVEQIKKRGEKMKKIDEKKIKIIYKEIPIRVYEKIYLHFVDYEKKYENANRVTNWDEFYRTYHTLEKILNGEITELTKSIHEQIAINFEYFIVKNK